MIVLWPVVGCAIIVVAGILVALNPAKIEHRAQRLLRRPSVARGGALFTDQRDHLVGGVGPFPAYVLIVSASLPLIVIVGFIAGMVSTHQPVWSQNVSLFAWFMREGPTVPASMLRALRGVSKVGSWHPVLLISAVASVGLFFLAKHSRWLAPVLVGLAIFVERSVQVTIGFFVHQPHPPTTLASYPSGGVARVVAVYGFIAFLYLRLRKGHSWRVSVFVWTFVALFAFLEGFARAALLLHWPFDIPGGWLLGVILLAVMMAAATVFDGSFFPTHSAAHTTSMRSEHPSAPQQLG